MPGIIPHSTIKPEHDAVPSKADEPIDYEQFIALAESKHPDTFEILRNNIIGNDATFSSPFGLRRIVYADYFASGKSLSIIEDYIQTKILPTYANTHTEQTHTGKLTSEYRLEARNFIRNFVNGDDVKVIFSGSGSTACLNKLVSMFRLKEKHVWESDTKKGLKDKLKSLFKCQRPVVFISYQEHHANIIPWRRGTFVDLVMIKNNDGMICLADLEEKLKKYSSRPLKIGSFTAGSNVVGVLIDTEKISALLHQHGAFAIWDYAGVGSYVPIVMDPKNNPLGYKDAVVLSPHKMIGGPQTPGILVIQTSTLRQIHAQNHGLYTPSNVGGGIVNFVSDKTELWIQNVEELEEAGTPAIVESIRAGLVFKLKKAVGCQLILKTELDHARCMISRLSKINNLWILGDLKSPRIPVLSFLVKSKHSPRKVYHFNFITALLNDLFGIQSRGGCMCAALFVKELLMIPDDLFLQYGKMVSHSIYDGIKGGPFMGFKPGFTRLSLNYFISHEEMEYIFKAIEWVCANAHKMIGKYDYSIKNGSWKYCGEASIINSIGHGIPCQEEIFNFANAIADSKFLTKPLFPEEDGLKEAIKNSPKMQELRWFMTDLDLQ